MGTPTQRVTGLPVALTIAGSDSGGGAGIQADLKTFFALGCHGASALTALTAQNTVAVTGIHEVPAEFVVEQVQAVADDIGVAAAKTGMLASAAIVEAVAKVVSAYGIPLVVDPVFVSKHGNKLLMDDAVAALKGSLFPVARLVTPNLFEAGALLGRTIETLDQMRAAAVEIGALGPEAVLVKGGHLGDAAAIDVFFDGTEVHDIESPRFDTEDTHGTGCTLSAAITARLAHGDDLAEAVDTAKRFISGAIQYGLRIGKGYGPVNPGWAGAEPHR